MLHSTLTTELSWCHQAHLTLAQESSGFWWWLWGSHTWPQYRDSEVDESNFWISSVSKELSLDCLWSSGKISFPFLFPFWATEGPEAHLRKGAGPLLVLSSSLTCMGLISEAVFFFKGLMSYRIQTFTVLTHSNLGWNLPMWISPCR
jgi:hypothetical protein